jgi:hypothetical protein
MKMHVISSKDQFPQIHSVLIKQAEIIKALAMTSRDRTNDPFDPRFIFSLETMLPPL